MTATWHNVVALCHCHRLGWLPVCPVCHLSVRISSSSMKQNTNLDNCVDRSVSAAVTWYLFLLLRLRSTLLFGGWLDIVNRLDAATSRTTSWCVLTPMMVSISYSARWAELLLMHFNKISSIKWCGVLEFHVIILHVSWVLVSLFLNVCRLFTSCSFMCYYVISFYDKCN